MADPERLRDLQLAFAAHIRDPQNRPAPAGIEDRRMAIYRELFFNNVRDLLGRGFPVLRKILGAERWDEVIRDFLVRHRAHTPLFLELPREFLAYLRDKRQAGAGDPPFMQELAHYEWVELALSVDERRLESIPADPSGDLLDEVPLVSPLAWALSYRFPVHRLAPDFQPGQPGDDPTLLVVFRSRDHRIGFLEINRVTARLLELLGDPDAAITGRAALESIADELAHPNPAAVVTGGRELLEDLRTRDVILGTRITDRADRHDAPDDPQTGQN
jgi:hypothetical protein